MKKYEIGQVTIFAEADKEVRYQASALNHECEGESVSECLHKLAGKIAELDNQDKPIVISDLVYVPNTLGAVNPSSPIEGSGMEVLSLEQLAGALGESGDQSFREVCASDPAFSEKAVAQLPMVLAWMAGVCRRMAEQVSPQSEDVDPYFPVGLAIMQGLGMTAKQTADFGKSHLDDVLSMTPVSAKGGQA